jgi:DNA-binding CsgD family transcriptional regulator
VGAFAQRDVAALLSVSSELERLDSPYAFPPRFLQSLRALVGADWVSYSELDRARRCALYGVWWWDEDCQGVYEHDAHDTPDEDEEAALYWRLKHTHPLCSYREQTNDWTSTRAVSQFMTYRGFQQTEIWNALYRDCALRDWLDVGIRPTGARTRMFIFGRAGAEFGDRERRILDLLRPHLQRRYDATRVAAEAADALASLYDEEAEDANHVVLCSIEGIIEFASPRSRRLLSEYLDQPNGRLPGAVLHALRQWHQPIAFERNGRRLTLRAAESAGLLVILLGEHDTRVERLTPRQRTILHHLASGKSDAEIAATVGIAVATVGKHLEQIYRRLDVRTRTAAAAVVSLRPELT